MPVAAAMRYPRWSARCTNASQNVVRSAPFSHRRTGAGGVTATRSASGLVTALAKIFEVRSGTWIAHGSGDGDRLAVDATDGLDVIAAGAGYRLRYVWLTEDQHQGYYCGFSNGLWPLCHDVGVEPVFRLRDFRAYEAVNRKFVAAVVEETGDGQPVVLVQDYHFALAPRFVRRQLPRSKVLAFWHIPWPEPGTLRGCPWAPQLLDGLLGSEIVGFQTDIDQQFS